MLIVIGNHSRHVVLETTQHINEKYIHLDANLIGSQKPTKIVDTN
jgi:hypothetical protein